MGILVTAVILTISYQNRKTISDEEVIKRAKALGMVESTYLSEIVNNQNKPEESKEEVKEPEGSNVEESSEESQTSETEASITEDGNSVVITIARGDSSTNVARKLEELGVITDYKAFDRFLAENGDDKRIKAKAFTIPKDATWEEIAKIITNK